MKLRAGWLLTLAAMALAAPHAGAHFRLLEPQSWMVGSNLGDPQKLGPCGGASNDSGTPTNAVNKVQGGQILQSRSTRAGQRRSSYFDGRISSHG